MRIIISVVCVYARTRAEHIYHTYIYIYRELARNRKRERYGEVRLIIISNVLKSFPMALAGRCGIRKKKLKKIVFRSIVGDKWFSRLDSYLFIF